MNLLRARGENQKSMILKQFVSLSKSSTFWKFTKIFWYQFEKNVSKQFLLLPMLLYFFVKISIHYKTSSKSVVPMWLHEPHYLTGNYSIPKIYCPKLGGSSVLWA